jgi:hypothetical protein
MGFGEVVPVPLQFGLAPTLISFSVAEKVKCKCFCKFGFTLTVNVKVKFTLEQAMKA